MLNRNRHRESPRECPRPRARVRCGRMPGRGELRNAQALQWRAELHESSIGRFGIFSIGLHENLQILGGPWLRMDRHRVTSDHEILNAVLVQRGQEFFEIWVHPRPRPSLRIVPGSVEKPLPTAPTRAGSANSGIRPPSCRRGSCICEWSYPRALFIACRRPR